MKEDRFDEEYLLEIYKKDLDPCEIYRCNNISKCNIVSKDKRKEIIMGLAKITINANKEIAKLFKKINPDRSPKFTLKFHSCKDYNEMSVDIGSPYP
jgi:hypothetical protein|tara:strand:- start:35 stop:325 length:291 start_codon:yes stop_codon:yes gene_type:complete